MQRAQHQAGTTQLQILLKQVLHNAGVQRWCPVQAKGCPWSAAAGQRLLQSTVHTSDGLHGERHAVECTTITSVLRSGGRVIAQHGLGHHSTPVTQQRRPTPGSHHHHGRLSEDSDEGTPHPTPPNPNPGVSSRNIQPPALDISTCRHTRSRYLVDARAGVLREPLPLLLGRGPDGRPHSSPRPPSRPCASTGPIAPAITTTCLLRRSVAVTRVLVVGHLSPQNQQNHCRCLTVRLSLLRSQDSQQHAPRPATPGPQLCENMSIVYGMQRQERGAGEYRATTFQASGAQPEATWAWNARWLGSRPQGRPGVHHPSHPPAEPGPVHCTPTGPDEGVAGALMGAGQRTWGVQGPGLLGPWRHGGGGEKTKRADKVWPWLKQRLLERSPVPPPQQTVT